MFRKRSSVVSLSSHLMIEEIENSNAIQERKVLQIIKNIIIAHEYLRLQSLGLDLLCLILKIS